MIYTFILMIFLLVLELKGNGDFQTVKVNSLNAHNFYRKRHNVPPLKISPKLNKVSQNWANHLAKIDDMEHRPNSSYGENIYMISSTRNVTRLGVKAVNAWYSGVKYFDFKGSEIELPSSKITLHFTQVVWKSSEELGQGAAKSKSGKIYVVCNYNPPGNYIGYFKQNVLPLKKKID